MSKIDGNNSKKQKENGKKWFLNADCNTMMRNDGATTLNQVKITIFGKKNKKVNDHKSEENIIKEEEQQDEQDSECTTLEYNVKTCILIVFRVLHFLYCQIENEFIFIYFFNYCMEFCIKMKNTLNSVFKSGIFVFFVLLVCPNIIKIES